MDKWKGTAVPNTGLVEKVYLNIHLSDEEITEICSKLTMKLEGWAEYILNTVESSDISLYIVDLETAYNQKGYAIINAITEEKYYVSTQNEISDEYTFVGWNPDFNGEIVVNKELTSEYNGVASGSQNELIFELFSSEPIVKLKLNLDEFLTDLADSIRYVKGTEEKVNAQNYSSEIRKFKGGSASSTPVDNGAIYEGKYRVRYFDTDGTILKIEYVADGGKTTPPDNPSYDPDYLIFAEWNYDIDNYIVEQPTDIGATYNTVGDVTYIFVKITNTLGLQVNFSKLTGYTSIDWGDGTVNTATSHTYLNEGEYIIKIGGVIVAQTNFLGSANNQQIIKKAYVSNGSTFTAMGSDSLEIISLPRNSLIDNGTFKACASLKFAVIPRSNNITGFEFNSCYSLKKVSLGQNITSIPSSSFNMCYSLEEIVIPLNVTNIPYAWYGTYPLSSFVISKNVTQVDGGFANSLKALKELIICCKSVPTLTKNFTEYMNKCCTIWVNDSIIEQLKVATNWATYAAYMKPLSWYPSLTEPNA